MVFRKLGEASRLILVRVWEGKLYKICNVEVIEDGE